MRRLAARLPRVQQQQEQQEQQQQAPQEQPQTQQQEVTAAASTAAIGSEGADASSSSTSTQQQEPAGTQDQQQQQLQPGQGEQQQQPAASTADAAGGAAAAHAAAAAAVSPEEDGDEERPVLPITRVAYQPGSSERCLLWLGGPAAGQVSEAQSWAEVGIVLLSAETTSPTCKFVIVPARSCKHCCPKQQLEMCCYVPVVQVLQCSWTAGQAAVITGSSTAFAGSAVVVVSVSASGAYRLLGTADGQVLLEETGPAPR